MVSFGSWNEYLCIFCALLGSAMLSVYQNYLRLNIVFMFFRQGRLHAHKSERYPTSFPPKDHQPWCSNDSSRSTRWAWVLFTGGLNRLYEGRCSKCGVYNWWVVLISACDSVNIYASHCISPIPGLIPHLVALYFDLIGKFHFTQMLR